MKPMIHSRKGRTFVAVATMFLPWRLKRLLLTWMLGYQLDPSARIGHAVVAAASVRMGKGAHIGHLTVCRGLKLLEIGDHGRIGNLNWITGDGDNPLPSARSNSKAEPILRVGTHSAITPRHYIDCSDRIEIGAFTTVAGVRSQFLTHSIDLRACRQQAEPITIGDNCFIGTGCIVLSGAKLPDFSVLAAGSVLRENMGQPWTLYAGVPARARKRISEDYAYFHRTVGYVE
jgi:acetyltransferase-like isoleucine patch superfamily enzyme